MRKQAPKFEIEIQGDYGQGWESLVNCENMTEARETLKDYNDNEPQYAHRIKKVKAE